MIPKLFSRSGASEASERSVAEHLCYPACVLLVVSKFHTRTYVSKMSGQKSVGKNFFVRFVTYVTVLQVSRCTSHKSQVTSLIFNFVLTSVELIVC